MAKQPEKHAPKHETKTDAPKAETKADAPKSDKPKTAFGKVAKPSKYLEAADGSKFKFTPFALPKKAVEAGKVTVDGKEIGYQVTSNKGFTTPDTVINYSWMTLPNGDTGYIAHDYGVEPKAGVSYTVKDGVCDRKDPVRVPKDATVGAERIAKFKQTQAAKAAAKPSGEAAATGKA